MGTTEAIEVGLVLAKLIASVSMLGMEISEYHKMAAVEDAMWYYQSLHRQIEILLTKHVPLSSGPFLDAGCGTGGLIKRLRSRNPAGTWQGVDYSPLACELARERTGVEIIEASLTDLPLASGTFAAVVSADVIYHIEDDQLALNEMARVLQPEGILIINVPAYRWLWSYHDQAVHSKRRYDRRELREKLQQAGFECLTLTHGNMFLLPLIVLRRKLWPAPASGSDVQDYPSWLNGILKGVMAMERVLLAVFGCLPFGSSLLAVARKTDRT